MIDFSSDPNFNKGSEEIFESEPQILSKNQSQVSIDKNNAISNNPSIESSPINPADAFEVFQGKLFLPKGYFLFNKICYDLYFCLNLKYFSNFRQCKILHVA